MESDKNNTNELFTKQKETYKQKTNSVTKGEGGGEINQGDGINIYTLVDIKQIIHKNLLYRGNSTQYFVINYTRMEKNLKNNIHI